ncbi:hypothetical protein Tco_0784593 [Tanacetum coccineum]
MSRQQSMEGDIEDDASSATSTKERSLGNTVDELDELGGFESFRGRFRRVETSDKSELTLYLEEPEISRKRNRLCFTVLEENQAKDDEEEMEELSEDIENYKDD